ncbi:DUF5073 domain-containing protein [Skermania sp. ID1734]|uniref:DUF5073 family protein n=1 Tax=Skermania sp. ID1734 TaxID=2597516 RepID=UPI00117D73A7|nr:DUF5073 family protein [Skermania sp. ID1734]TSD99327.1 DUF5073 domain-containing protein [Skermania sp. ID1734]
MLADSFDQDHAAAVIGSAIQGAVGPAGVLGLFAVVPGAVRTPARRRWLGTEPERLQLADWRYEVTDDRRVRAAHVVHGIVLAEQVLAAGEVGPHLARALAAVSHQYGAEAAAQISAALEVLEAGPIT